MGPPFAYLQGGEPSRKACEVLVTQCFTLTGTLVLSRQFASTSRRISRRWCPTMPLSGHHPIMPLSGHHPTADERSSGLVVWLHSPLGGWPRARHSSRYRSDLTHRV